MSRADPSAESRLRADALTLLRLAEAIPPDSFLALQGIASISLAITGAVAKFKSNKKDWTNFGKHIQNTAAGIIHYLWDLDTSEMLTRETVKEKMEKVLEVLNAIRKEINQLQRLHPFRRVVVYKKDPETIADMKKKFDATMMPFPLAAQSSYEGGDPRRLLETILQKYGDVPQQLDAHRSPLTYKNAASHSQMPAVVFNTSGGNVTNVAGNQNVYGLDGDRSAIKMTLNRLVYAEGASWDPTMACLPGTRATELSVIHAWARSFDGQNVFWLKGVAGSGKSAIAHTIAQSLHKDGRLASSFFFNRSVVGRNTSQLLLTTIARDIAARYPAIAADICATLEDDPSLASAPLCRQFEECILGPLRRHPIVHSSPLVIVIDALDETINDEDSDIEMLRILRAEVSKLPPQLRILVTSRPTRDIVDYLSEKSHITSRAIDITSVESGQDIEAYIGHQLRDEILCKRMGSPDSTKVLVRDLKNLAEGLFIWIVTVFRYLRNADNPEENLRALLSKSDTPGRLDPMQRMDSLYTVIIEACGDWADPEFCKGYRMFMGAIMAAKRPLSLSALRALHGGTPKLSRGSLPQRFGSVLVGLDDDHEPIRILHLSFHEFITKRTHKSSKFRISKEEHSGRLAELCLQTMVREITAGPIHGTGYLLKCYDDEPGIPQVFGVSEQLLYSCEYWSDHVSDVDEPDAAIAEVVQGFLLHHSTVWIEIVSSISVYHGSLTVWHWLQIHVPEFKEQGYATQASTLHSLSMRLEYAGRLEEALVASQEALHMYRALAAERPAMFNVDLARSLACLPVHLSALGRREDALVVIKEAVDLYRTLAAERPVVFNADLARSLANLSVPLLAIGRHDEGMTAIKEALGLYRPLAAERPAAFNDDLASSLACLSASLSALGRHEEGMIAIKEALHMYRALAAERPAVFNAALARSLAHLSVPLSAIGRHEEALATIEEALDLYRALAAERPVAFSPDLAMSLACLSVSLAGLGRHEEGMTSTKEAVDLYRALAAERPAVFNVNLAMSLNNLSLWLSDLGRHEEALVAITEALEIYRDLVAERPEAFNFALVKSLGCLSVSLAGLGRHEEGMTVIMEALDVYRTLAAERPLLFNADLAMSLNNSSLRLSALGRHDEALVAMKEAVDMYRALAAERPVVFSAALARSLANLSVPLSAIGWHEEGVAAIKEALDLYRAFATEQPVVFSADLAMTLNNLSLHLSALGRYEESMTAMNEAVDLYRALAAEQPAVFSADLAMTLNNSSLHFSALGRHEEALVAIREALNMYRGLAAEQPGIFNVNLANSLNCLSCWLSDLDRYEEALVAITEALEILGNLAAERPGAINLDLACSLDTISSCFSHLGRGEDALVAMQEAINLCRALGTDSERPADFNRCLYLFLVNLSARLSYFGRWQEGLTAIHEAAKFRRALASERPALHDPEVTKSVEQFSTFLLKAGHKEEARLILLELLKLKIL